jgi:hypothetical protein
MGLYLGALSGDSGAELGYFSGINQQGFRKFRHAVFHVVAINAVQRNEVREMWVAIRYIPRLHDFYHAQILATFQRGMRGRARWVKRFVRGLCGAPSSERLRSAWFLPVDRCSGVVRKCVELR